MRQSSRLHATRPVAAPRTAATLILLRDGPTGLEVLLTRRALNASFGAGAYVFPGGVCDADDELAPMRCRESQAHAALAATALREAFEELGVLLASDADGHAINPLALKNLQRTSPLWPQLRRLGYQVHADLLYHFCHFTTDPDMPKRFATSFFVAAFPQDQVASADESEQFDPRWFSPAEALTSSKQGAIFLMFPTIRVLQQLGKYHSVAEALADCATDTPKWVSTPRAGLLGTREKRFMEHEPEYGELLMTAPDGQKHNLAWRSHEAVRLGRYVQRLTAPNPSMMTGPGTNTYLLGDAESGYLLIDPGPDIADHIARLHALVAGASLSILCTHSHPDHSPAAKPLAALTGAVIYGSSSRSTAKTHSEFSPDLELVDGQQIKFGEHCLTAIYTPGHAANHFCFYWVEDRLLFSGDHVLNGSTTVIDPPDGDMDDYLQSLDTLIALDPLFILPAHGHVLAPAVAAILKLKQHRLKREQKLLSVRARMPEASMDACLPFVYDDVAETLWPIARRSLLAHWQRLEKRAAKK